MSEERSPEERGEDVDPERLRQNLLHLASLIRRLDSEDRLLEGAPRLLKLMGDLRSQLFEYEVRCTGRLLPKEETPPEVQEAERIVQEAARRLEEAKEEWSRGWLPEDEEEEEES